MNDRIKHQMVSIVFLLSNNTRIRPPFCRHRIIVLWRVCITQESKMGAVFLRSSALATIISLLCGYYPRVAFISLESPQHQ